MREKRRKRKKAKGKNHRKKKKKVEPPPTLLSKEDKPQKIKVEKKRVSDSQNNEKEEKTKKKSQRKPRKSKIQVKEEQIIGIEEVIKENKEKKVRKTRKDKGIKRGPKNKQSLALLPNLPDEKREMSSLKVEDSSLSLKVVETKNEKTVLPPTSKSSHGKVPTIKKKRKLSIPSQKTTLLALWKSKPKEDPVDNIREDRILVTKKMEVPMQGSGSVPIEEVNFPVKKKKSNCRGILTKCKILKCRLIPLSLF